MSAGMTLSLCTTFLRFVSRKNDRNYGHVCFRTTCRVFASNLFPFFHQIAPVLVSQSLLERMRNNFMIVEVWDKKTNSENDKV